MIIRLLHLSVVAALIVAAAFVYKIKFESTVRAAELTQLAAELKHERDAIAALRAEWAELDNPDRIQGLVERHLTLRMLDPSQIVHFDDLPERPAPPGSRPDAIAAMIDAFEARQGDASPPASPPPSAPPQAAGRRQGDATGTPGERP